MKTGKRFLALLFALVLAVSCIPVNMVFAASGDPTVPDDGDVSLPIGPTVPRKATVQFLDWDGAVLSTAKYSVGDTVVVPAAPTREADDTYTYEFAGWDKEVVACAGDTTYTATYTRSYINYTVEFRNWDDAPLSTDTYHWGDAVTEPATPTREGNPVYTYTATYTRSYINYTVEFRNWDDAPLSTDTYHWGDAVTEPATPTREGNPVYTYTFAGWDKDVVACAGDTTYYAVYEAVYVDYTVTFQYEDGTPISIGTYHYGDQIEEPEAPAVPDGLDAEYVFTGWDKTVDVCTGNTTYTAVFGPASVPGDVDGIEGVTEDDAIYLLLSVLFGDEMYPTNGDCDLDGVQGVTEDDAIYLLLYVLFGDEMYPLH